MRTRMLLVTVMFIAVLAACGGGDDDSEATDTTAQPAAAAATITIKDFKFSPTPLSAKVGDTVTVANEDGTNHSVTADDNSFDTEPFSSGTKTITVSKAGAVGYHCKIHNSMKGVIQVAA